MKTELNAAMVGKIVGEISLFREMANIFNKGSVKCTYVEEIHLKRVSFISTSYGFKRVELGDQLFITFDKFKKELRICVLQSKYKKNKYRNFLNFRADLFQWDLLKTKPMITNIGNSNFPSNILNFRTDYKSITAYGIFYHDINNNDIDFLYTVPDYIAPCSAKVRKEKNFHFRCKKGNAGNGNILCTNGIKPNETISTCSIDRFEQEVLSGRIGAPINNDEIKKYILSVLSAAKLKARKSKTYNTEALDEILLSYEYSEIDEQNAAANINEENLPSIFVVVTDSKKYNSQENKINLVTDSFQMDETCTDLTSSPNGEKVINSTHTDKELAN